MAMFKGMRCATRETNISPEQFEVILQKVTDQPFRDFLRFLWHTGARPQEVREVTAKHVELASHRFSDFAGKRKTSTASHLFGRCRVCDCRRALPAIPQGAAVPQSLAPAVGSECDSLPVSSSERPRRRAILCLQLSAHVRDECVAAS